MGAELPRCPRLGIIHAIPRHSFPVPYVAYDYGRGHELHRRGSGRGDDSLPRMVLLPQIRWGPLVHGSRFKSRIDFG